MTTHAASLSPAFPGRAPWGTAEALRAWQRRALDDWLAQMPRDYLAVATPGAGKTTFALQIVAALLERKIVQSVTVVAPTDHLKRQWADAAHRVGVRLDPGFRNAQGSTARDFHGVVVTYAQVAAHPMLHRRRTENRKSLVVLDEIHHAGDALSWGDAVREAFDPAAHRLSLTGTPFRSDVNAIPFVSYDSDDEGLPRSRADHSYGYAEALRDGVVRPVLFLAYSGRMRWRTRAGDEIDAQLGEQLTSDQNAQALRTALDPKGDWIPAVLAAADSRLSEVRRSMPDAAGMVIAADHEHARAYASLLRRISGEPPVVVLSDDPRASRKIDDFTASKARWIVAVRMVSEGVDVPRLAVGVYATNTATPLFFAQAVGRFVRARRRGETASVFVPSVPALLQHAAELEEQRDHVLGRRVVDETDLFAAERDLMQAAEASHSELGADIDGLPFEALGSDAHFDRVLFDGGEFGLHAASGSAEEQDFLGLPGLLEPDQVTVLLNQRQAEQLRTRRQATPHAPATDRSVAALRKELNGLVAAWHHRTGEGHGAIHAALRSATGGPPTTTATVSQLQQRIETLRGWATRSRR
ncbi:MAG: DEAD/DEAH box helicase [Actinomycetes bacterium]